MPWIQEGRFIDTISYRQNNLPGHLLSFEDSKPSSWYNFWLDVPLMTPVIAIDA